MHVGSLSLLTLPANHRGDFCKAVRRLYARRLALAPVLSRTLAGMPLQLANPVWVQAGDVDIEYPVQRVVLPRPGTQQQLEECVGRLHSILLDRTRPLWRVYVIEGLQSGQAAYYPKIHHALVDGQAAIALARLFDPTPRGRRIPPEASSQVSPGEHPGLGTLAAAALQHDAAQYLKFVRTLPDIVRTLTGLRSRGEASAQFAGKSGFAPRTPLNVAITGERGFAGVSVPLGQVKAIAAAHDAKVNDVVLGTKRSTVSSRCRSQTSINSIEMTAL